MEKQLLNAFKEIIPKYIPSMKNQEKMSPRSIQKIKNEIKKELSIPIASIYKKDMARFIIDYQISEGLIKNREEFESLLPGFGFIINNLEQLELDSIADSYFSEKFDIEEEFIINNNDGLQSHYLKDDPDWFAQIGLSANPFPSQDGLYLISKEDYEEVVIKTEIYNRYMEIIEQDPEWILNKSTIIYGDFGCGKTTFFDYLDYHLILNNILPIRIILNAKPSLSSLHQSFNESLFNELAFYISNFTEDPRGYIKDINNYSILTLFSKIKLERNQIGFVIFLDGLHKSQDQENTALNFMIELQNILEFYRRKGISLTILIAGSLEWHNKINNNKKFSGSIFTLEKMDPLTVNQSYEMLKRRFAVFSEAEPKEFFKYNEIELLVTSIEKTLATDVNYRILIKYFLQNGFIFKNLIKIKPLIEEDVLSNIFDTIKNNKFLFNNLNQLKTAYRKNINQLRLILKVISTTYDMGYFFEKHPYFQKNTTIFQNLHKRTIIIKSDKYQKDSIKPYSLNMSINETFKEIEYKVKFRPTHYLELLFLEELTPIRDKADYMNILDTLKRFGENNPEYEKEINDLINLTQKDYFVLIEKIEKRSNFHISEITIEEMNNIIEQVLRFIYKLSGESFQVTNQKSLFDIFKYSWLDNQVLTQFFNWSGRSDLEYDNKYVIKRFLKLFIDTFESMIFKIGKHILYNRYLIVGSKNLNNSDKVALNSSRALFSEKSYKDSINKCHGLIERKIRSFIFNILHFKYGVNWESLLPKSAIEYITNIKKKEQKRYGEVLSDSANSLYYLTRSFYSMIVDNNYLWSNCFSILFGESYKSFFKTTLEEIANLGHLDKHDRSEDDISKVAILIQQLLAKSKDIVEKINRAYINLINIKSFEIKKMVLNPKFKDKEKSEKISEISFKDVNFKDLKKILISINEKKKIFDNFIDLSNTNKIQDIFSLSYEKFIASIFYLIRNEQIKVIDNFGPSIILNVLS